VPVDVEFHAVEPLVEIELPPGAPQLSAVGPSFPPGLFLPLVDLSISPATCSSWSAVISPASRSRAPALGRRAGRTQAAD